MVPHRTGTRPRFGCRARGRSTHALLPFVAAVAFACASPAPPPEIVMPGSGPDTSGDAGILVLHVDTNVPLSGLEANRRLIRGELAKGRYVWLVHLPAGRYAWTEVAFAANPKLGNVPSWCPRNRIVRFDPLTDLHGVERSEYEFDVEAGTINYPGELILRADYGICGMVGRARIRNRNHSAMALQSLMKTHAAIVDGLPIRYAGSSGDEFLQFFVRERANVAKGAGREER
jgi:hypothetical protein